MDDENKRQEKTYLEYDGGKIKEVDIKKEQEEFEKIVDDDEELAPIADYLKKIDELSAEEAEVEAEAEEKKAKKQYINLSEHKHIDGEEDGQESDENWIEEENKKPTKEKSNFKLPVIYISSYTWFLIIMIACVVGFMYFQKNPVRHPPPQETQTTEPSVEPISTFDPAVEELIEISRVSMSYLDMVDTLSEYHDSELKVLKEYMDGNETKESVRNLISQAAIQKDEYLNNLEKEKISSEFTNLNSYMQRIVRAELNASKKVLRDIETSQKPVDMYTSFSGTASAINSHITKMCNELESKLKKYSISYYRSGNSFKF